MNKILLGLLFLVLSTNLSAGPREDWQAVADSIALNGHFQAAESIETALNSISDAELEKNFASMDVMALADAFTDSGEALNRLDEINLAAYQLRHGKEFTMDSTGGKLGGAANILSAGLPVAVGYPGGICPFSPDRSDANALLVTVDAIAAGNVALEIARGLWSVADRACGTVVVAAGFGGNPQNLGCILTDTALFIAQAIVTTAEGVTDHIAFCDAAVDSAEIEGSYERTGHIHTDLDDHATAIASQLTTHDTSIASQLTTHDTDISNQVTTHDTDISNQVGVHDVNISAQIAAHHAAVTTQISIHDADIKARLGEIQGTVDENQRLIQITMARQAEIMRLLITPSGRREINPDVVACTGADCPPVIDVLSCSKGGLGWPCK